MQRTVPIKKEDGKTYDIRWMASSLKEIEQLFLPRIFTGDLVMVKRADVFRLVSLSPIIWKAIYREKDDIIASKRSMDWFCV